MIVETSRSLLIVSSVESFIERYSQAQKLLSLAERLQLSRRYDALTKIVSQLEELPLSRNQEIITQFYKASCLYYKSQSPEAIKMLEQAMDNAPMKFRARACLRLGAMKVTSGDIQTGRLFYNEAWKLSEYNNSFNPTDPIRYYLLSNQAVILGMEGNNRGALNVLRSLSPIVSAIKLFHPAGYHDYQNNIAVELAELREFDEALYFVNQALASPFASQYPEWLETRREIEERRRGCRPQVKTLSSNCVSEELEPKLDLAAISLPDSYASITIDQLAPFRKDRYWPKPLPWEGGFLGSLVKYKSEKEAAMKDKTQATISIEEIQKLPKVQQQIKLVEMLLTLRETDQEAYDQLMSIWIKQEEIPKILMELILSNTAPQDRIDQTISFFCAKESEAKEG